jgi:hypothetical protein
MRKLLLTTAGALALMYTSAPAHSASIWPEKATCDTTEAGKSTPCRVIHVEGKIFPEDWKTFREIANQDKTTQTVVQLNSPGGALESGLTIGIGIHLLKYNTWVGPHAVCGSVCAAIWVAGNKKLISQSGAVGFHQSSETDRQGRRRVSVSGNATWQKYYDAIGISKPAAAFFLAASIDKVFWLNSALAKGFDIDVKTVPDPKEEAKAPEAKPQPEATIPQTKPGA